MSALSIAADVGARQTSAREIVTAALNAVRASATLNAFTSTLDERALARAKYIDAQVAAGTDPGPLAAVPFAAKNLFDVAGSVTRAGAAVTAMDPPAARDADAIAALERAGAILIGLTNMDEFAYGFTTENAHDGTTRNPHDRARIAGGSSGGSASAVAAGIVPLSLGSDTNGSIRVPSALCGIFGLRPTFGALSRAGAFPFVNSLDAIGPFARNAADLRAAYAALADTTAVQAADATGLRVARLGGYFDTALTPEAREAVDSVAKALGGGATVVFEEAERARKAAFVITAAEAGQLHMRRLREHASAYDPAVRDRLLAGALVPAGWYVLAQRFRTHVRSALREIFVSYDVLLAPATPYPATLVGQTTIALDGVTSDIRSNAGAFTQPVSFAGVPVLTVPVVQAARLPVGVQLIGPPGSEATLFALAQTLEEAGAVGAGNVPVAG